MRCTVWVSAAVKPEFESQTWTFTVPIYDGRLMAYGTCYHSYQCCGLVTFWYGSASGRGSGSVPYLCLTDPDAGSQKTYGSRTLLKSHKEVTEEYRYRRNQGSYYFYLIMKKDPDPWLTDPDVDPGGPKHTYPTNPDPQHWFLQQPDKLTQVSNVEWDLWTPTASTTTFYIVFSDQLFYLAYV